ncbi:F-box/LRR-repeat protein At3g03360-like [Punica granatum]|uniref:F-box domain-containing protein n=2 Tax=Punica granatum TaxID=22663 RepID=A0A218VQU7_PUNGR|nr:F-box/LRR-repeat protein At3g03360-like [Punica granatum]OWM62716.1 hypothetical protein CDL15_Pgr020010 [Punica granatum]PKI55264.1 hypothetical protein CRG98_024280 [Punica granatum]
MDLPDDVIHHIFSFMPTKDVVKICASSTRTWTHVQNLEVFDFDISLHKSSKLLSFTSFMDRLDQHYPTGKKLKRFSLRIWPHCHDIHTNIDSWILFAVKNKVKHLSLDLQSYPLPDFMCLHSGLESLHISDCKFRSPWPGLSWGRLKELSICSVRLSNNILRKILSGSPVLELLKLQFCRGLNKIRIGKSRRLRELVIDSQEGCHRLEIIASSLLILRLRGNLQCLELKLTEISSVVEAELDLYPQPVKPTNGGDSENPQQILFGMFEDMLNKLRHVSTLHIGYWCQEMVSRMIDAEFNFQVLTEWKNLIIVPGIDRRLNHLVITTLLDRSPHLENLELRWIRYHKCYFHEKEPSHAVLDDQEKLRRTKKAIFEGLVKYLTNLKTLVMRWPNSPRLATMQAYDFGNGGQERVQLVAQIITSHSRVCDC